MHQLNLPSNSSIDYYDSFRKLYYHLYSNSSASRAERIISDISKLLLTVLAASTPKEKQVVQHFLDGKTSANDELLHLVKSKYPNVFDESDRFGIDDKSLRMGLESIWFLDLKNAPSHMLGDAFQALIGPNLRGDKGQFFTPKSVVRCMIEILAPSPASKVVDPACGTGGFLTEVVSYWEKNNAAHGTVIGIDKDKDLFILATALLSLSQSVSTYTVNQNSLDKELLNSIPKKSSPLEADFIITNPPFGSKIPVKDQEILSQYDLGYHWEFDKNQNSWVRTNRLRSIQDPQTLFIELCVDLLKQNGRMGIVLPEGIFGNKTCGYIWDYLRSKGQIIGLIDCPRTTFQPGTDTKTNILFFEKCSIKPVNKTKIAVALNCGHDRRGRSATGTGVPNADDFRLISADWSAKIHKFCFDADITNPYYLVPRYYDQKTNFLLKDEANSLDAEIISLGEMIKKGWITIKKGHEVGSDVYGTGEIPFIRTSDISNFEISIDPTKSVSEEIYSRFSSEQSLQRGDILMVVDGRYRIGRCAILHGNNEKCIAQSHLRIIKVNVKKAPIDSYELLYLLSMKSVQRDIRSLVFIQSTLGSIGSRIKEIRVPIPKNKDHFFKEKVNRFRAALEERAKLLNSLMEIESQIVEL
jgi:type I restriction enzyme M protein